MLQRLRQATASSCWLLRPGSPKQGGLLYPTCWCSAFLGLSRLPNLPGMAQVRNGAKVFAEASQPQRSGKGAKTQIGRWKGLDEDISDDQVTHTPCSVKLSTACPSSCQYQICLGLATLGLAGAWCWSAAVHSALCFPCCPLLSYCHSRCQCTGGLNETCSSCPGTSVPDVSALALSIEV